MELIEKYLGESNPKPTNLSFGDEVDQNRKSRHGMGNAKIDASIWSWADKKFAKASGSTITNQATAIQKQEIKIHKPKGRMGTTTLTIKPLGDYIMVHDNKGGGMSKPTKKFFKV